MADYRLPTLVKPQKVKKSQVLLVASGDLRLSANQNCWPAQQEMEQALSRAVAQAGYELVRTHPFKPTSGTGSSPRKRKAWKSSAGSIPRPN